MITVEQYWFGFVVEHNKVSVSKAFPTKEEADSFKKEYVNQKWLTHDQLDKLDKRE